MFAYSHIDSLWPFYAVWIWLGMASAATLFTPLHAWCLRHAPRPVVPPGPAVAPLRWWGAHWRNPVFVAVAGFVVLTMTVTAALPAHMIVLLQEAGLSPAWVVAIPAAIGASQVVGRALLWLFERR